MKEYKSSRISRISESMQKMAGAIADAVTSTGEAIRPDNLQVFQISHASGLTSNFDFTPSFVIRGIDEKGRVQVTGQYPVHANNGAGGKSLYIESESQLTEHSATQIRDALKNGAKLQDCLKFSEWLLDGKKTDETFARGRDLPKLAPVFGYSGERGLQGNSLQNVFNIAVDGNLDRYNTIQALDTFIKNERAKYVMPPTLMMG